MSSAARTLVPTLFAGALFALTACGAGGETPVATPGEGGSAASSETSAPKPESISYWSFWKEGYPALMVTDTAPFRYPYYHHPADTPDKVDYDRLARVVAALEKTLAALLE